MDSRNETRPAVPLSAGDPTAFHLTDEQFTDLLLGAIPPAITAHLEACPQCAREAQLVSGAVGSFEQHSRLWAERRAAARPILAPAHQPILTWLNGPAAWSAVAATLVLAAVAGFGNAHRGVHAVQQPPVAAVQAAPQVSPATLKADNDLLSAIDGELSADAAPPASLYGLKVDTHAARAKSLKRMSN